VYDSILDVWTVLPQRLLTPRMGHASAVLGHKLYVCGGFYKGNYLDSVECLGPALFSSLGLSLRLSHALIP
jgi:hypothetical protein